MNVNQQLSKLLAYIGSEVKVQVDRPLGSQHPMNKSFVYPINFGQTSDMKTITGSNVDAYVMGVDKPCKKFKGICIAIVYPPKNKGFRLIVAPKGKNFSHQEMQSAVEFQEKFFNSKILRKAI